MFSAQAAERRPALALGLALRSRSSLHLRSISFAPSNEVSVTCPSCQSGPFRVHFVQWSRNCVRTSERSRGPWRVLRPLLRDQDREPPSSRAHPSDLPGIVETRARSRDRLLDFAPCGPRCRTSRFFSRKHGRLPRSCSTLRRERAERPQDTSARAGSAPRVRSIRVCLHAGRGLIHARHADSD